MPLGLVSEIVLNNGYLPQLAELDKRSATLYTRKNGIVFSVFWFIFFVPILTWMFGGVFGAETLAGITALIGVFGSLMLFIFSLAFLKRPPRYIYPNDIILPSAPVQFGPDGRVANNALPPHTSVPASVYAAPGPGHWRETNELERQSVTESTTRLLNEEER